VLISNAYAQAAPASGGFDLFQMLPLVLMFVLLYFLFAKFSPMISIWEFEEGLQVAAKHAGEMPEAHFAGQVVPGDVHPGH